MEVQVYSLASDGSKKLSEHFRVREFKCKDGSDPIFISPELVDVLEKIRVHFGAAVTVTSAYRTVSHNKSVGGATKSKHCLGIAADIKVKGQTPAAVAAYANTMLPSSGGIGTYSTFTHIDVRTAKSRWKG